jgi:hypothetical protein
VTLRKRSIMKKNSNQSCLTEVWVKVKFSLCLTN